MIKIPGKRPQRTCGLQQPTINRHGWHYPCNRHAHHTGRHAFIHWGLEGALRAVWGER